MIKRILRYIIRKVFPEISILSQDLNWDFIASSQMDVSRGGNTLLYPPYHINHSTIGDYSYIAQNSYISQTTIGKFCSIGPNFVCGWGIHPTSGISTSPMFYSTMKQNGVSLSKFDKIIERKPIHIGNDVFIGANVTVLDGVTIGDGAVIGAGAVVSKDIPPYAIAIGCPIRVNRFRLDESQIKALKRIEWWNYDDDGLRDVEKYFFNIDKFIELKSNYNLPDES